ncbi:uncharacterized protein AC631_05771 [Debaryomyces fabryi]|uniref:Inositol phosphorylceramide synthase regulatory subunit KEI1 n=1 Tax=Debaryomyces fabryi TaxID=58627 RepID=A0A0V1PQE3_9ASCO|nr:uncharacterized protein AC631_05771 [Debaryomyces fabryi]KRZ98467.1 hypothetical protein AC631_05771 [Debaryomyces fabryi]CUM46614.1 unnamed protein product [Debaryomyces fabryi]
MTLSSQLNQILPQKFFGFVPLYIGVELILAVAIINKAGGVYGILSIITGHPLNFWQWLYNILAILVLPSYISGLIHLKNRKNNTRKLSLACLIYVVDSVIGLLYTYYFIYFWFSREDNNPTADPLSQRDNIIADEVISPSSTQDLNVLASQSASPGRELFLTVSSTIIITGIRFYFTLVVLSFTKALLKQDLLNMKYDDGNTEDDEDQLLSGDDGIASKYKKYMYNLEIKSKEILRNFFS